MVVGIAEVGLKISDMKSEVTQTSPIIQPRTRSLSVSTDFTDIDDIPLLRLTRNSLDSGISCSCKLNSTGSVTGSTTGSTTGSSISTQTEKINTKTTDAGSTWFQMIDLADPLDYPKKYICNLTPS